MSISLEYTVFERPVSINTSNIDSVEVTNCQFSNFEHNTYALYIGVQRSGTLYRCCFSHLNGTGYQNGYRIEANYGMMSEISNFDIKNIGDNGGLVQSSACSNAVLTSSNTSNTKVDHICVLDFVRTSTALVSYINAVDCSATKRGVGVQFEKFKEHAALQHSNFIRIYSEGYGIVRSCYSNHTLFVIRCYFTGMFSKQKAFYGETPIRVFRCSSSLRDCFTSEVAFDSIEEVAGPLPVSVLPRRVRTHANQRVKNRLVTFFILFYINIVY